MARTAGFDRTEILKRARDLFWRKGYHATSLKDLEAALQLKPGSIYAAFGSKAGLFAEALNTYAQTSRTQANAVMDSAPSPLSGLADYVRSLGAACDQGQPSQACMLVKTVLEFPEDTNELRQTANALMAEVQEGFAKRFEAAKAAGEIAPDANTQRLARRFQADVIGLRAYAQRSAVAQDVRELADDIAEGVEALRV